MNLQVAALVVLAAGAVPALPQGCGGGTLASVTYSVDTCQTFDNVSFQGQAAGTPTTLDKDLNVDMARLSSALGSQAAHLSVHLKSVTFTALSGVTDMGFVDSAQVDVAATGALPQQTLLTYAKGPQAVDAGTATGDLVLDGSGADLTPYVGQPSLALTAHLTGTAPSVDWSAKVVACYKATAEHQ